MCNAKTTIVTTPQVSKFSLGLIFFIVFVEGFASIAIEMLVLRQLIPFVGNSIMITSMVIGVFLLFLALGYHRGGTIKKHLLRRLQLNLTLAGVLLGLGLSISFVRFFFSFSQMPIIFWLVTYLLLILAPLIYCIGQTLPITMRLMPKDHEMQGSEQSYDAKLCMGVI